MIRPILEVMGIAIHTETMSLPFYIRKTVVGEIRDYVCMT